MENENVEKAKKLISNENEKSFFESLKIFLSELFNILDDTDKESTIESVKKEISFRGHNAWILIFSIFVASVGLNVSSAAVVIGAMLISPLMGPIVGVGLSVAINDIDTLKRSLINLGVMIVLSILTAYLYFLLSPLTKLTPELEARTYPTILDVLIAIFGGLALIVAKTKKGTIASVIFGVAIATALMPPLCTAGYGLAVGNFEYFGGAFYLFTINSIFIALSAFLVAKLLRFPLVKYANSKRRKRIAQIATAIALIVMIPSTLLFWKLLQQEIFASDAETFVVENVVYEDAFLYKYSLDYDTKTIEVFMGGEPVPEGVINTWRSKLMNENKLKDANLKVNQSRDDTEFTSTNYVTLSDMFSRNLETLESRDKYIRSLEEKIERLTTGEIPFDVLSQEIKINYQELDSLWFSNNLTTNFSKMDTVPVFTVKWKNNLPIQKRRENEEKLKNWLEFKLNRGNIIVKEER